MMRYYIVLGLFVSVWTMIVLRLYHLSIKSNYYYERLAKQNFQHKEYLKPVRGEIFDAKGRLLAINEIGFSVSIAPHLKTEGRLFQEALNALQSTFDDINATLLKKVYRKQNSPYNHKFIKAIEFIPYEKMLAAYPKLAMYDQIHIDAETKRYYPYGKYASHIVGYTGRSNEKENASDKVVNVVGKIGKSGLERYYNKVLQGELGHVIYKVTATNKAIDTLRFVPPKDNRNLTLFLDIDLQKMIYDAFFEMNQTGVAIVMRTDGAVLSAVSYPAYDPNMFVGGISVKDWQAIRDNLAHPFTNKIVHGTYPPGSTIKMGMALAFDAAVPGILNQREYCKGYMTIGKSKHKFRCWHRWGHGTVGLRKAIRESCDVYFYNKSLRVGINAMAKQLRRFGLGVRTGIDLPREFQGVIPDKAWKKRRFRKGWFKGETVIAAIGQGYDLVTPIQVARYTAMIATGKLVRPRIAREVDGNATKKEETTIALDPAVLQQIRQGMYDVCHSKRGTAYRTMHDLPVVVAGKTGTSQVTSIPQAVKERLKESELAYFHRSHAWITTYAPFDHPKYIVTVLIEHGGHGGSAAGPLAAEIYRWLYRHGYFSETNETSSETTRNETPLF